MSACKAGGKPQPDYDADTLAGLEEARKAARMGVPIFACRLTPDGDPVPPPGWQKTEPGAASLRNIDRWKPGMGLCAVTGVVYDVLDSDPRNGSISHCPGYRRS